MILICLLIQHHWHKYSDCTKKNPTTGPAGIRIQSWGHISAERQSTEDMHLWWSARRGETVEFYGSTFTCKKKKPWMWWEDKNVIDLMPFNTKKQQGLVRAYAFCHLKTTSNLDHSRIVDLCEAYSSTWHNVYLNPIRHIHWQTNLDKHISSFLDANTQKLDCPSLSRDVCSSQVEDTWVIRHIDLLTTRGVLPWTISLACAIDWRCLRFTEHSCPAPVRWQTF